MGYKILRLAIWLLPLYLGYQLLYQANVLIGMQQTYNHGDDIIAEITDFRIKHIASQTNGYVVLRFRSKDGELVEQKLSLPVQLAAPIQNSANVSIRYMKGASQEIVMIPTYPFHQNMVLVNLAVLSISLFFTILVAIWAMKVANRRLVEPEVPIFTRVDRSHG